MNNVSILVMALIAEIDKSYLKFLGSQLSRIVDQNNSRLTKAVGYIHNGEVFLVNKDNYPIVLTLQFKPTHIDVETLHESHVEAHDEWLATYNRREDTIRAIRQKLSIAVKTATNLQDLRDMLPDHVFSLLKIENAPERSRPSLEKLDDPVLNEQLKDVWPQQALTAYNQVKTDIDVSLGYRFFN